MYENYEARLLWLAISKTIAKLLEAISSRNVPGRRFFAAPTGFFH